MASARDTVCAADSWNGTATGDSENVELLVTYSNFYRPIPPSAISPLLQKPSSRQRMPICCFCSSATGLRGHWWGLASLYYLPQPAEGINDIARNLSGRINHLPFLPVINKENPEEIAALVNIVDKDIAEDDSQVR